MEQLTFEQASKLENGTKFFVYDKGDNTFTGYIMIGTHSYKGEVQSIVAISDSSHYMAKVMRAHLSFYLGYDSEKVGEILIKGLKERIKHVKHVYLP